MNSGTPGTLISR